MAHSGPKPVARELDGAIEHVMASEEWRLATSDAVRARILKYRILDTLHSISPLHVPSAGRVRETEYRERRDARMRALFCGRNYQELAEQFRLTTRQIRRIVDVLTDGRRRPVR